MTLTLFVITVAFEASRVYCYRHSAILFGVVCDEESPAWSFGIHAGLSSFLGPGGYFGATRTPLPGQQPAGEMPFSIALSMHRLVTTFGSFLTESEMMRLASASARAVC